MNAFKIFYITYFDMFNDFEYYCTSDAEDFCFFIGKLVTDDNVIIGKMGVLEHDINSIR